MLGPPEKKSVVGTYWYQLDTTLGQNWGETRAALSAEQFIHYFTKILKLFLLKIRLSRNEIAKNSLRKAQRK